MNVNCNWEIKIIEQWHLFSEHSNTRATLITVCYFALTSHMFNVWSIAVFSSGTWYITSKKKNWGGHHYNEKTLTRATNTEYPAHARWIPRTLATSLAFSQSLCNLLGYILFSLLYIWGKCLRIICNWSHSLKGWSGSGWLKFPALCTWPHFSDLHVREMLCSSRNSSWNYFQTKFCIRKSNRAFWNIPALFSCRHLESIKYWLFPIMAKKKEKIPSTLDQFVLY